MKRFKNILAVYNDQVGADAVLDRAASLGRQNKAILTLLDVTGEDTPSQPYLTERERRLERVAQTVSGDGLDIRTRVVTGKPFYEIIRAVLNGKHDLVILAAESPGGFRELLFGSTSMHLMRKCPCPVWVLKPGSSPAFTKILAAIDPKEFDEDANKLNHKILQLSSSLAEIESAELHVAHAWQITGSDTESLKSELPPQNRQDIIQKHAGAAKGRVERLVTPYSERVSTLTQHVHKGDAWDVVSKTEHSIDADLIVIGTITNAAMPGFLIGTTAEMVLRQASCSVLTVKPDNFVSPIAGEHSQIVA